MNLFLRISIVLTGLLLAGCEFSGGASGSSGPLNEPANLKAHAESYDSIRLTWQDDNSNVDGYEIYRREGRHHPYMLINATYLSNYPQGSSSFYPPFLYEESYGITRCRYLDSSLESNTTYYYYVRAFNSTKTSHSSNVARDHTPSYTFVDALVNAILYVLCDYADDTDETDEEE
ncbi:MAG: fibronectin type III domain-containing protein [Planctomycetota bacterium]